MIPLSVLFFGLFFIFGQPKPVKNEPSPLSSHVLDTELGKPAENINIILYKQDGDKWTKISEQKTNKDGRVKDLITTQEFTKGIYKLHYETQPYYKTNSKKTFYPYIEVVFEIENTTEHYHVPILITAYGFSTYRGS